MGVIDSAYNFRVVILGAHQTGKTGKQGFIAFFALIRDTI